MTTQGNRWARLDAAGIVAEIILDTVDVDGVAVALAGRLHPDLIAALVPLPDEAGPGWRRDGDRWLPPADEEP